jgi:hypothetical protein
MNSLSKQMNMREGNLNVIEHPSMNYFTVKFNDKQLEIRWSISNEFHRFIFPIIQKKNR